MTYDFGNFQLIFDRETGFVKTEYADGAWTGCEPNSDDGFHAKRLLITAGDHRLVHELVHHLVGKHYYGFDGSEVLYNSAHRLTLPGQTPFEEWMVTALTYFAYGQLGFSHFSTDAIERLTKKCDVQKMASEIRWLMAVPGTVQSLRL